jgi:hypothetical protein
MVSLNADAVEGFEGSGKIERLKYESDEKGKTQKACGS